MNFNESTIYYRDKYRRFKRTSDEIDTMILEYRETPTDVIKTVLWFNVARLSLDTVWSFFKEKYNQLDNVVDDYMQVVYFSFENALRLYDIDATVQFNSYFKTASTKAVVSYYQENHVKPGVRLGANAMKNALNGKASEWASKQLLSLNVNYLSDLEYDDTGDSMIEGYLAVTDEDKDEGNWNRFIKPVLLKYHKINHITQFEMYYDLLPSSETPISGHSYTTISDHFGVSNSYIGENIRQIVKTLKSLVVKDERFGELVKEIFV